MFDREVIVNRVVNFNEVVINYVVVLIVLIIYYVSLVKPLGILNLVAETVILKIIKVGNLQDYLR